MSTQGAYMVDISYCQTVYGMEQSDSALFTYESPTLRHILNMPGNDTHAMLSSLTVHMCTFMVTVTVPHSFVSCYVMETKEILFKG